MDKRIGTEISLQEALHMLVKGECDNVQLSDDSGYKFYYKDGLVVDQYDRKLMIGSKHSYGRNEYYSLLHLLSLKYKWVPRMEEKETAKEKIMSRKKLTGKEVLQALIDGKKLDCKGYDYNPLQLDGDKFVDNDGDERDIDLGEDWYLHEGTDIDELQARIENQEKELAELKEKLKEAGK